MSRRWLAALALALAAVCVFSSDARTAPHPQGQVTASAVRAVGADPELSRIGCLDCHATHGALSLPLLVPVEGRGDVCMGCHTKRSARGSDADHPLGEPVGVGLSLRLRERGVSLGAAGGVVCSTCHPAHGDENAAGDCDTCHADKRGHSGERDSAACLDCHTVHVGVGRPNHLPASPGDPNGCLGCHAPGRDAAAPGSSPGRWGHPVHEARLDGKVMACSDCHDSHQPGIDVEHPCLDCHEEQLEAAARGGHGELGCLECHPAHSEPAYAAVRHPDANPRSRPCLGCHDDPTSDLPQVGFHDHPDPLLDLNGRRWQPLGGLQLFDAKGELVPEGHNGVLTCASCHLTHGPQAGADSLRFEGWRKPCASCHGQDALTLYRYFHRPERREHIVIDRSWLDK